MNFSDYLEETEGYLGWSQKEDYNSWCARMRHFRDEFRSTQSDSISNTVRDNLSSELLKQGVGQSQRKVERAASNNLVKPASETTQVRTTGITKRVISSFDQG
ncbi:hypothetical protein Cri9333_4846 (plasmid) [Crinalium epipsammum PCC 9333]|uniref:Uncharacterized protein n=1 Tax=Crinalium epipsammum PCC 9333 TaxID=1173022 RepID=K9W789_9CYAN|nr:hypothetical protein [Crinalium epipsammum]AFZ15612.1 hypothetical protein Cri9333_4846 [Crinalium epipsammum PCC 9333]